MNSISTQTFHDYEVIVTDDSNNKDLPQYLQQTGISNLRYSKNPVALNSPRNWNHAIGMANGKWIKLMHDDDWFINESALQKFADAALSTRSDFIFSGFEIVDLETNKKEEQVLSGMDEYLLRKNPMNLLKKNVIGHPSTTLIRNERTSWYDERLRWVVDIEFYIRLLRENDQFHVIHESLIGIGKSKEQITKSVFRNPSFEIPENIYLLNTIKPQSLKNIVAYDYYWRLIRNLSIRNMRQLREFSSGQEIPAIIETIVAHESKIPVRLLQRGPVSKVLMLCSYVYSRLTNTFAK